MEDAKLEDTLVVKNLSKNYANLVAVDQVSFSVQKGSVFGLLGANGAGKSTTIECILGTRKRSSGEVTILGQNPLENRKNLFEKVGVQFQESSFQENIKVKELCDTTKVLYKDPDSAEELLKQFGMKDKENTYVKDLSGGLKQRLFIVLALLSKPQIVFLDELTTGLDVKARREVWQVMKQLKKEGRTIILTSHFMDEVENLCDEIGILKNGKLVFLGTVSKAIEQSPFQSLEEAYLWYSGEECEEEYEEI